MEATSILLILITFYTYISHDLGITVTRCWVEQLWEVNPKTFTVPFILETVTLILGNNSFFFTGKNYIGIKGTAMGTRFAPVYANCTIKERNFIAFRFRSYIEKAWKSYFTDCFIFWVKSLHTLEKFNIPLNNLHPSLQITNEMSSVKLSFLDVVVIILTHNLCHQNIFNIAKKTYKSLHTK